MRRDKTLEELIADAKPRETEEERDKLDRKAITTREQARLASEDRAAKKARDLKAQDVELPSVTMALTQTEAQMILEHRQASPLGSPKQENGG